MKFTLAPDQDIRSDLAKKYPELGDIAEIYAGLSGPVVHKWHHYLPIYEHYFSRWRGKPVRFLEIGVFRGGSLRMWRQFFGPQAVIYGVDIDKSCAQFDGIDGQVRIGSQDNARFLARVVREMGGIDIVLDDGSHRMEHIEASLDILFPKLDPAGTYMIEDLHTAFWPKWGGGVEAPANFFNSVRGLIDDMHRWYHRGPARRPNLSRMITGIHVHDSIVVLDKGTVHRPVHSMVGGERAPATAPSGQEPEGGVTQ